MQPIILLIKSLVVYTPTSSTAKVILILCTVVGFRVENHSSEPSLINLLGIQAESW